MFKKLFKRPDATLQIPELRPPVAPVVAPTASDPETFKERRKAPRTIPVGEVIEGNGGDTDWGLWNELVEKKEKGDKDGSYEPTVPTPLGPR